MRHQSVLFSAFLLCLCSCGTHYTWSRIEADASRTGVTPATADNSRQALGYIEDGVYYAPSGRIYSGGATPQLAEILIDRQPGMVDLKQVIAYAPKTMAAHGPQSELSNFAADCVIEGVEKITGRKVDVSILNYGGIRCAVPQGDVLMDDIVSMFPFTNYLVYVEVSGERLREIFANFAERHVEVFGGAEMLVRDRKLVSLKVDGQEVEDDRTYGLATIDFLLKGGDRMQLGEGAIELIRTDVLLGDCILEKVKELTAAGLPLEYHLDNRILIEK